MRSLRAPNGNGWGGGLGKWESGKMGKWENGKMTNDYGA